MLPTQLPSVTLSPSESLEPATQSIYPDANAMPSMTGADIHHVHYGATVEDLSRAVYVCIAVAILLFIMAVVLSIIIGILIYKKKKQCELERANIARRQSDEIWSTSV